MRSSCIVLLMLLSNLSTLPGLAFAESDAPTCATEAHDACMAKGRTPQVESACAASCVAKQPALKKCYFARERCAAVARDDTDRKICEVDYLECSTGPKIKLPAFEKCAAGCVADRVNAACGAAALTAEINACQVAREARREKYLGDLANPSTASAWQRFGAAQEEVIASQRAACEAEGQRRRPELEALTHAACPVGATRVDLDVYSADVRVKPAELSEYEFDVRCVSRCDCLGHNCPFLAGVRYRKLVKPALAPRNTPETRAADLRLVNYFDETRNRHAYSSAACFKAVGPAACTALCAAEQPQRPPGAAFGLSRPGAAVVKFLGELSGAVMPIGCTLQCECGATVGQRMNIVAPDPATPMPDATIDDRAHAADCRDAGWFSFACTSPR